MRKAASFSQSDCGHAQSAGQESGRFELKKKQVDSRRTGLGSQLRKKKKIQFSRNSKSPDTGIWGGWLQRLILKKQQTKRSKAHTSLEQGKVIHQGQNLGHGNFPVYCI